MLSSFLFLDDYQLGNKVTNVSDIFEEKRNNKILPF